MNPIVSSPGLPCYASGRPYRRLHPRVEVIQDGGCTGIGSGHPVPPGISWADWWERLCRELRLRGYRTSTLREYRHVLRSFARLTEATTPDQVTRAHLHTYIAGLASRGYGPNWVGMNISMLRTLFDRLPGQALLQRLPTPRYRRALPVVLSRDEAARLMEQLPTLRDRLLVGLLYGSGLKVGEACRLRWRDLDLDRQALEVANTADGRERLVHIPESLLPVLRQGLKCCPPEAYLFPGALPVRPLGTRSVQNLVRRAARAAGITKQVSTMTLRHSYAVHGLEAGLSLREVQEALGLANLKSAARYLGCLRPHGVPDLVAVVRGEIPGVTAEPTTPLPAGSQSADVLADTNTFIGAEEAFPLRNPNPARRFYNLLRTHLRGRFLATRTATGPPET